MSIRYWEYKGPFKLLWEAQHVINSYNNFMDDSPVFDNNLVSTKDLFTNKKNFTEALLNFDKDVIPDVGFYGFRFVTIQSFLYDYHKGDFFKHLSIDYSQGRFTLEPGGCRSIFMYAMEVPEAKAWIRSQDYPLPKRLNNFVTEVPDIPDNYNIITYPGLDWGAVSNDPEIMTFGPEKMSDYDVIKFFTVPEDIRKFYNHGSLWFSRPEANQELEALSNNISSDARWYIEMLRPDPIAEYHKHGQIIIALASVFSGVPVETSWIRTNDLSQIHS